MRRSFNKKWSGKNTIINYCLVHTLRQSYYACCCMYNIYTRWWQNKEKQCSKHYYEFFSNGIYMEWTNGALSIQFKEMNCMFSGTRHNQELQESDLMVVLWVPSMRQWLAQNETRKYNTIANKLKYDIAVTLVLLGNAFTPCTTTLY